MEFSLRKENLLGLLPFLQECEGLLVACFYVPPTLYFLPNSSGMCLQGAISDIGTTVSAGLPNLTGTVNMGAGYIGTCTGVFSRGSVNKWYGDNVHTYVSASVDFNASNSNTIYGASDTVQPPSLKVNVLIKHD